MMIAATIGSLINLYVIWRIRTLRARPSSQWRVRAVTAKQRRSELFQIVLAIITLVLVATEWITHPHGSSSSVEGCQFFQSFFLGV